MLRSSLLDLFASLSLSLSLSPLSLSLCLFLRSLSLSLALSLSLSVSLSLSLSLCLSLYARGRVNVSGLQRTNMCNLVKLYVQVHAQFKGKANVWVHSPIDADNCNTPELDGCTVIRLCMCIDRFPS